MPKEDSQWKKGQSGNPLGKPKGIQNSKTVLERFLSIEQNVQNEVTGTIEGLTVEEQIHLAQIKKAKEGDLFAYKEILDRIEGKSLAKSEVKQEIEQTTYTVKVKRRNE